MLKLTLSLLAAAFAFAACNEQVELQVASTPISQNLPDSVSVRVAAEQICSDTTFTDVDGKERKGLRDCKNPNRPCEHMGDTYCMMQDASLYGILDDNLTEANVKEGVRFHGKVGKLVADLGDCTTDGETGCVVPADAMALSGATIAANVVQEQTLAGVTGTHNPGFPNRSMVMASDTVNGHPGLIPTCAADGETSCEADGSFRAVALSELKPESIRSSVTLGGVNGNYAGAYSNCAADGAQSCITTSSYISLDKTSLDAAKIRTSVRLAGVTGSLIERPADCAVDGAEGCVTTAAYPAANFNLLVPQNLKNGATVAGVSGQYPSATYRLSSDTGDQDLSSSNFAARMASSQSFEYWDAAGIRHSGTGDADLTDANILTGTTIFGVTGNLAGTPPPCSASLALDCVTSASHVAYDASLLTAGNIKTGTVLATVTGGYPSASHPLTDATATADLDQSTFAQQLRSAAAFEFWTSAGDKVTAAGSSQLTPGALVTGTTIFGVSGNITTRPGNCADGLLVGCVTSASFPAYDPSIITEAVIKSGETVGNVTGRYPSITYPLADATATTDLTQGNFASRLPSTQVFEYWDSAGQRYTGQGDALLASSHLKKDLNLFGIVGNIEVSDPDCTAGNATNCVATSSYPSFSRLHLVPGVIKSGATIMGVTGTYPSAVTPLDGHVSATPDLGNQADLNSKLASSTAFEFFDSAGNRHSRTGSTALSAANIVSGTDIFGVSGSMTEQPSACITEGATGCLATAAFPAFDASMLTAGVIKTGETLGGITGQYPSASFPLPSASAQTDLLAASFNSQAATAGSYEFWDSAGVRHSKSVAHTIAAGEVLTGVTLFGVNGSASPSPVACGSGMTTSCVTSASFPSHMPSDFTPGIIKSGVTIAGTTGQYPSATFTLPGATNTVDLTTGGFSSRITNSAAFEYWDASGHRYSSAGSEDILPSNLRSGVNVFGVTGNLIGIGSSTLTADKIRYGVRIGTTTGTMRLNCREGSSDPAHDCSNVIVDATTDGACDSSGDVCILYDTITKMSWRQFSSSSNHTWSSAKGSCTSGWRLPTIKEMLTASTHGFVASANKLGSFKSKFLDSTPQWSATRTSSAWNKIWVFNFETLATDDPGFNYNYRNLCVR